MLISLPHCKKCLLVMGGIMINYYDNPAMSQSKLKDLKRSPKHFWTKHLALDRVPDTEVSHY